MEHQDFRFQPIFLLTLQHSYCISIELLSSSCSSCWLAAGARLLLLLLRKLRAGREAFAGGGPREEEEEEKEVEEEGSGATVALTLLLIPSWRPWFCSCMEATHTNTLWISKSKALRFWRQAALFMWHKEKGRWKSGGGGPEGGGGRGGGRRHERSKEEHRVWTSSVRSAGARARRRTK